MAVSRVRSSGWVQETGTVTRVTPAGWVQETVSAGGGSAAGSGAGVATSSVVGASISSQPASGAGVATALAVGASIAASVGAGDGVATGSGVSASIATAVGTGDGVATASAVGEGSTAGSGVGSGAGVATASAIGASIVEAVGSGDGVATASGISVAAAEEERYSGGWEHTPIGRPLTKAELRKRFKLDEEEATEIEVIAETQAKDLSFSEKEREKQANLAFNAKGLKLEIRHLEALNAKRQQLIDAEIARLMQKAIAIRQIEAENDEFLTLLMMAAM